MPSASRSQHDLMEAAAHTPGGYDGVPQDVGEDFAAADKKAEKFAIGGLAGHKLLENHPHYFSIEHPDGSEYKIAKGAISPELEEGITQHFSEGGPADAGTPPEYDAAGADLHARLRDYQDPMHVRLAGLSDAPEAEQMDPRSYEAASLGQDTLAYEPPNNGIVKPDEPNSVAFDPNPKLTTAPTPAPAPMWQPNTTYTPPPGKEKPMPGLGLPGTSAYDKGIAQEQIGIQEKAGADRALADQEAAAYQQHINAGQKLAAQYQQDIAANKQRQQDVINGVLSKKIDPDEWYNNKSTAGQISTSIAMGLGAFGAALTGGHNDTADMIHQQIENDLKSQKDNLAQGNSLLAHYVAQGHDLASAHELAKADLLDATAAQIKMRAAENGGLQSTAAADQAAGALTTKAEEGRTVIAGQKMANSLNALNYQNAVKNQPLVDARRKLELAYLNGDEDAMTKLSPPGELATTTDGRRVWAGSTENAKVVNENTAASMPLHVLIQHAKDLQAKGSMLSPDDQAEAGTVQQALVNAIDRYGGYKRWNPDQIEAVKKHFAPDVLSPIDFLKDSKKKLSTLERTINENDQGIENVYVHKGVRPGAFR